MSGVRVKICGLTREQDVVAAADLGADALGFVFARSPRQLSIESAQGLTESVPGGIIRVGLFMNQPPEFVAKVLDQVRLDLLQFHGDEDNEFCASFGQPFIKAISMKGGDPVSQARAVPDAQGLLLDSHVPGGAGGTGESFDWSGNVPAFKRPVWLAGGLNPENVAQAVRIFRPWAVDVSSGVESSPGIKNEAKMQAFIERAKLD